MSEDDNVRSRILVASAAGGALASLTLVPITILAGSYATYGAFGLALFFMALATVRLDSISTDTEQ